MLLSPLLPALQGFSPSLGGFPSQSAEAKASSARYAFNRATWGYLTTIQASSLPVAEVASFSDGLANASTGRLWFYMMDAPVESSKGYPAAITVSEASYNATCGFDGTLLDPEDPRCAKVRVRVRVRVRVGVRVGGRIWELSDLNPNPNPNPTQITISGMMTKSEGDDIALGKAALLAELTLTLTLTRARTRTLTQTLTPTQTRLRYSPSTRR